MSHGLRIRAIASQFSAPADQAKGVIPWVTILSIAFELLRSLISRQKNPSDHAADAIRLAASDCGVKLTPDQEENAAFAMVEDLEREPLLFVAFDGPGASFDVVRWFQGRHADPASLQAPVCRGYGVAAFHEIGDATDGDLKRVVLDLAAPFGGKFPDELAELAKNARTSPEDLRRLCQSLDVRTTPPREEPENVPNVVNQSVPVAPPAVAPAGRPVSPVPEPGRDAGVSDADDQGDHVSNRR